MFAQDTWSYPYFKWWANSVTWPNTKSQAEPIDPNTDAALPRWRATDTCWRRKARAYSKYYIEFTHNYNQCIYNYIVICVLARYCFKTQIWEQHHVSSMTGFLNWQTWVKAKVTVPSCTIRARPVEPHNYTWWVAQCTRHLAFWHSVGFH